MSQWRSGKLIIRMPLVWTVADPEIRSRKATSCDGPRDSTRGERNLICFSVFHVYFFIGGEQSL